VSDGLTEQQGRAELTRIIDPRGEISIFLPLVLPESGGDLQVFDVCFGDPLIDELDRSLGRENAHHGLTGRRSLRLRPEVGDFALFEEGRHYHRVNEVGGTRARWTMGGFLAPVLSSTAQVTGTNQVYLPLLMVLPGVGIQFGSGLDAQKNLINPGNTFAYGIAQLYYRYTVTGALDQPYLAEWSFNGVRQPQLDDSGTILSDSAVFTNSICTLDLSECSVPVPRGTYQVKFFIDDVLYGEASAIVQ